MLHLRSSRRTGEMNQQNYIQTVLDLYVSLPSTPVRPRRDDRYLAMKLYREGVALLKIECALFLGCARRELQEHEEPLGVAPRAPVQGPMKHHMWLAVWSLLCTKSTTACSLASI